MIALSRLYMTTYSYWKKTDFMLRAHHLLAGTETGWAYFNIQNFTCLQMCNDTIFPISPFNDINDSSVQKAAIGCESALTYFCCFNNSYVVLFTKVSIF